LWRQNEPTEGWSKWANLALEGDNMIVIEDVHKHFGGFRAVDGASMTIQDGSITGMIGPNGAGKSTLFNVIAGVLEPTSGRVTMGGEDITGLPPHELFHKGHLPDRA
jgi:branched-chain amino acid transport system ATP-binding protein